MLGSLENPVLFAAVAVGALCVAGALVHMRARRGRDPQPASGVSRRLRSAASAPASAPSHADARERIALTLLPGHGPSPLRDETGAAVDPGRLGLSPALLDRLAEWHAAFQSTFRADYPSASGFADIAAERAFVQEGNAIFEDLRKEWSGPAFNRISGLARLLREAARGLRAGEPIPDDRVAAIGRGCGIADIVAAIVWLDELARERDALPAWDGDGRDDAADGQRTLQAVLAAAPTRLFDVVADGLRSAEAETRAHVAIALAKSNRAGAGPLLRAALAGEEEGVARAVIAMVLADIDGTRA